MTSTLVKLPTHVSELWEDMVEYKIFTNEEIGIATYFGGATIETLNALLFYRTGCRDWDQYLEFNDEAE